MSIKYLLMTENEINDMIEFEDRCGVNTFLQELCSANKKVDVFKIVDENGCIIDYIIL